MNHWYFEHGDGCICMFLVFQVYSFCIFNTTRKSGLWWSIFPTTSLKHTHNVPLIYGIFLLPPLCISNFGIHGSCTFFSSDKTQSDVTVIGCRTMIRSAIYRPRFTHFLFVFEQNFKNTIKPGSRRIFWCFYFCSSPTSAQIWARIQNSNRSVITWEEH